MIGRRHRVSYYWSKRALSPARRRKIIVEAHCHAPRFVSTTVINVLLLLYLFTVYIYVGMYVCVYDKRQVTERKCIVSV